MKSQAQALIDLGRRSPQATRLFSTRTVAVTSGKGGVGKTSIAANLAIALRGHNKNVMLVDTDLGLANVDVMLNLHPRYNLKHAIVGDKPLSEIVLDGPAGVRVVPAASGADDLAALAPWQRQRLLESFASLEQDVDIAIVDTAPGLAPDVLHFILAANEAIIVTTPEPTAVTDAYALIKTIARRTGAYDPSNPPNRLTPVRSCPVDLKLFVNMARSAAEAQATADRIRAVTRKFLRIEVDDFGYLLADAEVATAARRQQPFMMSRPTGAAARSIAALAGRVSANNRTTSAQRGLCSFLERLSEPETLSTATQGVSN